MSDQTTTAQTYWDTRYATQGFSTVGRSEWSPMQLATSTDRVHQTLERLSKEFRSRSVLDFGCGWGRNTAKILDLGARRVVGVDINQWALNQASRLYPGVMFVQHCPGGRLCFQDGTFDTILSWTVLQHIQPEHLELTANELERVLRPGGKAILYENISVRPPKEHIWFRSAEYYAGLFPGCKKLWHDIPEGDLRQGEPHVLIVFRKRG